MKDRLTKEEVLHVAKLARIAISDEEMERYQINLYQLMLEIEKIKEIKGYDEELLFTPITHEAPLRDDVVKEMLTEAEIMKNVPSHEGNFIEVPVMIND